MKVAIVNDTCVSGHFGCQLVMETFEEQCARNDMEIVHRVPRYAPIDIPPGVDLVIVNGEGTIHHNKRRDSPGRRALVEVASRYPSVLVNCVWQENPDYPELRDFRYVAVRESLSQEAMPDFANAQVVPDVMFASRRLLAKADELRQGPVNEVGVTCNVRQRKLGFSCFHDADTYLDWMCRYKRLCIGRFHAACAACVLGIPFSTWNSNTHKTRGLMLDIGIDEHHYNTYKMALENVPTKVSPLIAKYAGEAKVKVEQMFEHISQLGD